MLINAKQKISTFFKSDQASGTLLILCVFFSLVIANSAFGETFKQILAAEIGFASDVISLKFSVLNWINDGLMTVFFFFIGLEIKHELINGHLSSFKKAAVPVFAAFGGAIIPALIYIIFNNKTQTINGWGIPMATDIAFALGVLSILGKLVPPALKVFLSTLAVVDDLLAILVIAVFYSNELHWSYLLAGLSTFVFLLMLNKLGIKHLAFYIIPGLAMWYLIHHSGIHATIAGVLTALAVPAISKTGSPLKQAAHFLATPVNLIIMPVFAIANTNIYIEKEMLGGIFNPLCLGILAGLILGKPIGVILLSWFSVKLKIGVLPDGIFWKQIAGLGLLAGIGFTMSIFVSFLSFGNSIFNAEAKLAILIASILAGLCGYFYLKKILT